MELFDAMPRLEGESLLLREMTDSDVSALAELAASESVYRLLPTFLFEQAYPDAHEVIARMHAECFDTKESILLAICPREQPDLMMGIAELYAYEDRKPKVSVGYRLQERYWGRGIATEVVAILTRYLIDEVHMRTITAHVMSENVPSARALQKNGYVGLYRGVWEDWGRGAPVLVDKYVYKRRWGSEGPSLEELRQAEENTKHT